MPLSSGLEALCNANAAAMGGIVATSSTYPLDTINKTMVMGSGESSAMQVCMKLVQEGGLGALFPGLGSKLGWSFLGKFVFYGSYSLISSAYKNSMGHDLTFGANLCAGYSAEICTIPLSLPLEAVATRLQTSKGLSVFSAISKIFSDKGLAGFYGGLSAMPALCITPAITNTIFTQIRALVLARRTGKGATIALNTVESFLIGAIARTVAVCIMYPFLRAKTMMQASQKKGDNNPLVIILNVIKRDGFLALYRGLGPELSRGVMSSAITLMCKERIYAYNRLIFAAMAAKNAEAAANAVVQVATK